MPCCFPEHRKQLCPALGLICLLCCVALGQTVSTSYAPGVDFSKYHTYKWVSVKGHVGDATLDAQIKQSFDSQLAARGLKKADENADLDVDYQAAISKQEIWEAYEDWTQTSPMETPLPQRRKVIIDVGTLVIDMYDTAAKQLVWTGRVKKTLDPNRGPQERQESLDRAAKKLLTNYPPK